MPDGVGGFPGCQSAFKLAAYRAIIWFKVTEELTLSKCRR
jgi:hypothetical protein